MSNPLVLVNCKAYEQGIGENVLRVARACEEMGACLAVQAVDVFRVSSQTSAEVWSQHVDPVGFGSHTGAVLPEAVKQAGAVGTLINHAEKQLSLDEIGAVVSRCKEVGLRTVVCASSVEVASQVASFAPDFVALELPELIGGDVSIVSADSSVVSEAVTAVSVPVLVGAGVSSHEDLVRSQELGAVGVLLASAVVKKADDPLVALRELYSGRT